MKLFNIFSVHIALRHVVVLYGHPGLPRLDVQRESVRVVVVQEPAGVEQVRGHAPVVLDAVRRLLKELDLPDDVRNLKR